MAQYINKDALAAEIEKLKHRIDERYSYSSGWKDALLIVEAKLDTLEVKEVDLEKESELIANGIMISVQSNKYGTNTYNTERNDFNHYHLKMAARKGIELGLKAQKGK